MIDRWSWQTAMVAFSVLAAATVLLAPTLRGSARRNFPEPATAGSERTLREELRRAAHAKPYLLLNAAFLVCGFHVTFIATYLPRYGEDLGPKGTATTALALIGLFNVFGSLGAGALGGRFSKTKLLAGIYALRAVVIAGYVALPASPALTVGFGCAIGVLWLSTVPLTSAMVSDQFGTAHAGALFGIVFLSHQFGALAGALLGANLYDVTGSYDVVWWIAVGLGVAAMAIHLVIEEGPVPEPPPVGTASRRLAPAGGLAAFVILVGLFGAFTPLSEASDDLGAVAGWCLSVVG